MSGREPIEPLPPDAKHQVLADGAMGFCGCINSGAIRLAKRRRAEAGFITPAARSIAV
jgi:hypothetical protein